jgi:anoctamin-10
MITSEPSEGGAGITPKHGEWENVESIFPLHDVRLNKEWMTEWARKTFLSPQDLDSIRDNLGEKVGFVDVRGRLSLLTKRQIAYYFAFLQSYFSFLILLAAFGFSCWVLLGYFSPIYAIVNGLWCVVFVEWWKRQEADLAIRWGVRNVSAIQEKRRDFKHEKEIKDPVTGETVQWFPAKKRLQRQLLQVPFALLAAVALGALICTCFGIEIFISEIYNGPLKSILVFVPTAMLTTLVPTISTFLTGFATKLNEFENYETHDAYDKALTSKIFVLNFITSYLGIFLTAFVYVPFASVLVPYLDIFSLTVKPFAESDKQMEAPPAYQFTINPNRLRKQVIYFTVTAQIVSFALETVVPLVTRKGTKKFKQIQSSRAEAKGGAASPASANDPPEEKAFLARVRHEASLSNYDVTVDLREMCIQFGYLSLFSVVWPLVPCSFLINNWIELRSDTFKITRECRRPNPQRADSIGPWLDSLGFLTWLGSITTAAIVYMFSNNGIGPSGRPGDIKLWALLLSIFASEHIYLLIRLVVRTSISKLDSENMRKERAERYMVRKRYLEETGLSMDVDGRQKKSPRASGSVSSGGGGGLMKDITRKSLEDEARESSLRESTPTMRFWGRQRGWEEVEKVGVGLIEMGLDGGGESKKGR